MALNTVAQERWTQALGLLSQAAAEGIEDGATLVGLLIGGHPQITNNIYIYTYLYR